MPVMIIWVFSPSFGESFHFAGEIAVRMLNRFLPFMLAVAIAAGCGPQAPSPQPPAQPQVSTETPPAPRPTIKRVGIWLDARWLTPAASDRALADLTDHLSMQGVTDLYVRTGPYQADGRFALPDADRVQALRRSANAREMRLWAWLPGLRTRVRLEDPAIVEAAASAASALADHGFDGIQFDIEPTPDGDIGYLDLLQATREKVQGEALLGVATHLVRPHPAQAEWEPAYFARVARMVDQVAVMAYDSFARSATEYEQFVAYQTKAALENAPETTEVLIGVPTYEDRTERRTPETEPLSAALRGVAAGFSGSAVEGRTIGWAIYAHFTTDEVEWQTFAAGTNLRTGTSPVQARWTAAGSTCGGNRFTQAGLLVLRP